MEVYLSKRIGSTVLRSFQGDNYDSDSSDLSDIDNGSASDISVGSRYETCPEPSDGDHAPKKARTKVLKKKYASVQKNVQDLQDQLDAILNKQENTISKYYQQRETGLAALSRQDAEIQTEKVPYDRPISENIGTQTDKLTKQPEVGNVEPFYDEDVQNAVCADTDIQNSSERLNLADEQAAVVSPGHNKDGDNENPQLSHVEQMIQPQQGKDLAVDDNDDGIKVQEKGDSFEIDMNVPTHGNKKSPVELDQEEESTLQGCAFSPRHAKNSIKATEMERPHHNLTRDHPNTESMSDEVTQLEVNLEAQIVEHLPSPPLSHPHNAPPQSVDQADADNNVEVPRPPSHSNLDERGLRIEASSLPDELLTVAAQGEVFVAETAQLQAACNSAPNELQAIALQEKDSCFPSEDCVVTIRSSIEGSRIEPSVVAPLQEGIGPCNAEVSLVEDNSAVPEVVESVRKETHEAEAPTTSESQLLTHDDQEWLESEPNQEIMPSDEQLTAPNAESQDPHASGTEQYIAPTSVIDEEASLLGNQCQPDTQSSMQISSDEGIDRNVESEEVGENRSDVSYILGYSSQHSSSTESVVLVNDQHQPTPQTSRDKPTQNSTNHDDKERMIQEMSKEVSESSSHLFSVLDTKPDSYEEVNPVKDQPLVVYGTANDLEDASQACDSIVLDSCETSTFAVDSSVYDLSVQDVTSDSGISTSFLDVPPATMKNTDDGDDGSRGSEIDLQGLSSRHEEALERIRQLEQQLEKSSVTTTPNEAPSLIKKLAQLDQEHAVVTERSAVLEIEVAKLRKQLSKEQKRAANEQEQLRQNVEERDKLNASLRELLNDNQVVAQKLQSDVQRLKAEVKRLQKIEAGSTNGDSRMSIERARHKTGDSTVPPVSVFSPEVVVEENASPSRGSPQWSSTEQLSRKMNDSSILKLSPGSHQSPDIERARHMTDGSEGHPENGILPVVNGEQSWTTAMSSSPDRANRSALRQDNERLSKEVLDLQHQLEEKSAELSETEAKLQGAKRDLRRLSEEVSRMNEELQEKHNLNNTLQMELSVYDQMHNDPARLSGSGETGGSQLDLTMLLEELRQLRKQLVQTIENNNKLRQKLEEQLSQGPARAAHHHYYMKGPNDREETDVESRLQTEALYSSTDSQRWQKSHGRQQPMGGKTSSMSGRIVAHQNGGDSIDSRLVPGGGYKDSSMRYSIHDPMRPPNLSPSRVGSDLRSLYAIGELDDYELLKKEISESITLLSGCEARVKERLKHFQRASPSQNIDHATLRGVSGSIEQLTFCLREQHRLVTLFWTSQLPRRDDQGSTVNQTLLRQNNHLQNQLAFMAPKYEHAKKQLAEAEKRLKEANNGKEQQQAQAVKRLSRHSDTLGSAENNMQLR